MMLFLSSRVAAKVIYCRVSGLRRRLTGCLVRPSAGQGPDYPFSPETASGVGLPTGGAGWRAVPWGWLGQR
jgi:hypothetical protein